MSSQPLQFTPQLGQGMRLETTFHSRAAPPRPVIFLMLHQAPGRWFSHKFKCIILLLLVSLILVQYFFGFGASIYNISLFDYRVKIFDKTMAKPSPPAFSNKTESQPPTLKSNEPSSTDTTNGIIKTTALVLTNSTTHHSSPNAETPTVSTWRKLSPTTGTKQTLLATNMSGQPPNMTQCPVTPPILVGPIKVWFDYPSTEKLEELYPYLEPGGHGKPKACKSRHRVAVIIPYRDRDRHLRGFLHNLHSLLTKQQLDYSIIVVEQISNQTFNRAKLMNVGFVEALKLYDWQCFIFHDVDLLPEDDRNLYTCPEQPRHMSVAVDKFGYKLPYTDIFGGICALTKEQMLKMNGFSNDYWGWGGEDDDIATRVKVLGYKISRYPTNIARYKMIKHVTEKGNTVNKCRYKIMYKTKTRWKEDGIGNLDYKVRSIDLGKLYTRIVVDLLEKESRDHLRKEGLC